VFACVCGGLLFGIYIRRVLPKAHLSEDTKYVIGLGMGLIGSLAALLLAMVTSSAKGTFDFEASELRQAAVNVLMLDHLLADFGPETGEIRRSLRLTLARRIALTWPDAGSHAAVLQSAETDAAPFRLIDMIRQLSPKTDFQRGLQSEALQITNELLKARWIMLEEANSNIPLPFLLIVVCWLSVIFAGFGLFAPRNATATIALLISALSVAGSVFLILELETPFSGVMKVSGAPLRYALSQLGP
jgi:hypothetical protein